VFWVLFNSYTFLLFLAVVLGIFYFPIPWRLKKLHLLLASYLFYAAWNPPFVVLLWISTIVDWFCARWMHASTSRLTRLTLLFISLGVNLGLLGFFKYANFFLENFTATISAIGVSYVPISLDIVLPVGISFYTFQTLSYTIDVFRKKIAPWPSALDFALYVTFFPQLVAGPIVRASEFLPQCEKPRSATGPQFGWGLSLLVLGLFQKVVVADGLLAPIVEVIYDNPAAQPGFAAAWACTIAFAGQIFCDFAGYSTCAIGVAMCLGFALPDNFRFPYAAIGFSDFWRRWHISLSSWLRDYLYIPLGGNRRGELRTYINLSLTMLLGGLWHGASWTFVVWGALHGIYLMAERMLIGTKVSRLDVWKTDFGKLVLMLGTFAAVCVTWVFFRASAFDEALNIVQSMFGFVPTVSTSLGKRQLLKAVVPTGCIVLAHWSLRDLTLEDYAAKCPSWLLAIILAAMIVSILMMPGEDRAFIYFQF
jgi:D-alanyl-lipoteichoic acid acyltransferase DltB (MBOAT superfamily)